MTSSIYTKFANLKHEHVCVMQNSSNTEFRIQQLYPLKGKRKQQLHHMELHQLDRKNCLQTQ